VSLSPSLKSVHACSNKGCFILIVVVLQVLQKDKYVEWSDRVKTYLMAHDLWEIIEATTEPPCQKDNEAAFMAWSKKNSMALHLIQISFGPDTFSEIIKINSAKIAWNTVAKKYNVRKYTKSGISFSFSFSFSIMHMLQHCKCRITI
jgi:hypothetical protein